MDARSCRHYRANLIPKVLNISLFIIWKTWVNLEDWPSSWKSRLEKKLKVQLVVYSIVSNADFNGNEKCNNFDKNKM